jgi:hypothetical protein
MIQSSPACNKAKQPRTTRYARGAGPSIAALNRAAVGNVGMTPYVKSLAQIPAEATARNLQILLNLLPVREASTHLMKQVNSTVIMLVSVGC